MKRITKEVKIAITTIVGIIILFVGLNFLKGFVVLSNDIEYIMTFDKIDGLSASCPIYADGYKVGVVRDVDFDYENHKEIKVNVDIDKNLRIPMGSTAEITSDLMGNIRVNILLANNPRERVEAGGIIPGAINVGVMGQAAKLVPVVEQMLPKLDSILVSINMLLHDPAIANSLHNVEGITSNLVTSTNELNTLMAKVNSQLPAMANKANTILDNTSTLTSNLAQVDVEGTMQKVNQTLDNVNMFTAQLNSEEGTIGKFMRDPSLFNNMNRVMISADSLVNDLKNHPKRYVHFSIFGRKDK